MTRLKVSPASQKPYILELQKVRTTLGRSPRNDLFLDDQFASRLHAELRVDDHGCWIHDLGSVNGTFVNGKPINVPTRIRHGDEVQVGSTLLQVQPDPGPRTRGDRQRPAQEGGGLWPETFVPHPAETGTFQTVEGDEPAPSHTAMFSVLEAVRQVTGVEQKLPSEVRRRDLFTVMTQVGLALLSPSSLEEVLQRILELIFDAMPADRAFLLLREGDALKCKAASYRTEDPEAPRPEVQISQSIYRVVLEQGQSLLTSDAQEDERFRNRDSIVLSGVRSIVAVPLSLKGQVLGLIYVDSPMNVNVFRDDDVRLLATIASVAAVRIENALLLEERIANERIRQQLSKARDLQGRLMPTRAPETPGYSLSGISFPCFEVGGDYFDFVPTPGGSLLLCLGDVSGKGMDAAILMSSLHAAVRVQADTRGPNGRSEAAADPAADAACEGGGDLLVQDLLRRINRYLYRTIPANRFVTFFLAELDPHSHRLTWANAGHCPPLVVRRSGEVLRLEAGGPPLGVLEDCTPPQSSLLIEPGDVMVTFSDGLTEATNPDDEEYGEDRLIDVIARNPQLGIAELRERIDESVLEFVGEEPIQDDVTLVLLKRPESAG